MCSRVVPHHMWSSDQYTSCLNTQRHIQWSWFSKLLWRAIFEQRLTPPPPSLPHLLMTWTFNICNQAISIVTALLAFFLPFLNFILGNGRKIVENPYTRVLMLLPWSTIPHYTQGERDLSSQLRLNNNDHFMPLSFILFTLEYWIAGVHTLVFSAWLTLFFTASMVSCCMNRCCANASAFAFRVLPTSTLCTQRPHYYGCISPSIYRLSITSAFARRYLALR